MTFDRNILMARALQTDNVPCPASRRPRPTARTATTTAAILFGPDGKLYIFMGDQGRRGWMQNLPNGPFLTAPFVDDTFGGPAPDNAHLSGVILRLNDDGTRRPTTRSSRPARRWAARSARTSRRSSPTATATASAWRSIPIGGDLWETENADDAFSEMNRVDPGDERRLDPDRGPLHRISDFKFIETTQFGSALQQVRYPPTRIAYRPGPARGRAVHAAGRDYVDPDLSWRYESARPERRSSAARARRRVQRHALDRLGPRFQQVGGNGGSLYRLRLNRDRLNVDVRTRAGRPRRRQLWPSSTATESETLSRHGFGTTPDIEQGPDGNLYVVSITDNAIYMISRK